MSARDTSSADMKNGEQKIFRLMDIPISNITMLQAVDMIQSGIQSYTTQRGAQEFAFINAHCVNVAAKNPDYLQILRNSHAVFPDGSGIKKAAGMLGCTLADNVNGTDMFPLLCRNFAKTGKKMFLLGAGPGIAEKTAVWADNAAKASVIAGYHDGFFSEDNLREVLSLINSAAPDLLLVAMGVPRQELWIHKNLSSLKVPVCMGVGGLFDFYSGRIKRAPLIFRRMGIEWVWRLLMEPGRMWKRYIIGNITFMFRIMRIRKNIKKDFS
ncbi:MAG: WecB/TagA/CpsF family glycosyltransferase [Spirochaetia bacterium]|nr:WecB/TagA/CpsF family glycosyltransferase [Spirochaetia bacterium]